ncbi:BlaI/MecI/CopY family transcriptional regulator [Anditalea andensis]|uniref:CopY family transcriptional repressor n=1 Tax=Anditalea andensis TaxID=1048983 RepID=A0A074L3P8_9BACT|nr:BlaI/MecI/CopY family transcriptional regulator [Anditalea andensis]KEO75804.1 CopY family transcriptional repressor [Anditalea andensis]
METLNPQEERIMHIFWRLEKALVRNVLNEIPDPKPPYTTLASHIKQLENKGFLSHKSYGNTHEYYPLISREDYQHKSLNRLVKNYFDGSAKNMLSYLMKENQLSEEEIQEIQNLIKNLPKP